MPNPAPTGPRCNRSVRPPGSPSCSPASLRDGRQAFACSGRRMRRRSPPSAVMGRQSPHIDRSLTETLQPGTSEREDCHPVPPVRLALGRDRPQGLREEADLTSRSTSGALIGRPMVARLASFAPGLCRDAARSRFVALRTPVGGLPQEISGGALALSRRGRDNPRATAMLESPRAARESQ
jgi:hypothetical protein